MNEQTIFLAALEIPDPVGRKAYLLKACAGDEVLRQQVEALLAAQEKSGEFLDVPAVEQLGSRARQPVGGTLALDLNSQGEQFVAKPEKPLSHEDTQAEGTEDDGDERPLDFLQPSTKPGSLGRLAHYEVLELLGQGGFGTVVKAFDEKLHRMVAIKIMSPQLAATSPARKRFLREARSSAAVRHENVVDIHAIEEQPIPFLVMEYVAGETLQQRLDRKGPLETLDVLRIGVQIANGLAAAHAMGKIHRDIKPANILLENGVDRVKITDFGLARAADDASLTQSGVIAGTPMYMSPEQAQGVALDQRADLFSFGSVLYVMCSGRPPFRASTTLAVLKRVAEDTPRPIQEIIPEVPQWLCDIITKLHAKKPEERFGSAREVADVLSRCLTELQLHGKVKSVADLLAPRETVDLKPARPASKPVPGTGSRPDVIPLPAPRSAPPTRHRHRRLALAAALLILLLVGLSLTEATGVTDILQGTVIRLFSPEGTLIVEVDDPGVSVTIDGGDVVIKGAGSKEIRVKPGQYKLQASKDGKVVRQEIVTVEQNGKQIVRISLESAAVAKGDPDRKAAEYVLSIGGSIRIKENGKEREIKAVGELPQKAFELTSVTLSNKPKVSDAGLAYFKGCKNLTILRLNGTEVGDTGLVHLKDCKNLLELNLSGTKVSDAGLAHFKDCKNLTDLWLWSTQVGDAGMAHFKNCKNLTSLHLGYTQVSDAGLGHFKDCKDLTLLYLENTKVSDAGLAHFNGCKNFTALELQNTKVSDAGLAHFKNCKNLTELRLGGTKVSDAGLAHFKECKDLMYLYLENTKVNDAGLAHFKECKNLMILHLGGTKVSDVGLAHFKECKDLTFLQLKKTKVTVAGIDELKKALPQCKIEWDGVLIEPVAVFETDRKAAEFVLSNGGTVTIHDGQERLVEVAKDLPAGPWALHNIHLPGNSKFTVADLKKLAGLKNLRGLLLPGTPVTDWDLKELAALPGLQVLDLSGTQVTNAGLKELAGLKYLRVLNLWTTQVSDAGLKDVARLPSLQVLYLRSTQVTDAGLKELAGIKSLVELNLIDTKVTDAGLMHLAGLTKLTSLELNETTVTAQGVATLQKALPGCQINSAATPVAGDADRKAAEYVLSIGGTVQVNDQDRVLKTAADLPPEPIKLTYVHLRMNPQVNDAGLAHFKDCKNLQILHLEYTQVTDAGLVHFKGFKNLTSLNLSGENVSDAGLVHFKDCKSLTQLRLFDTKLGDTGLAHFKDCKDLTNLALSGTKVSDAGLAHFKDYKNLSLLDLSRTNVSDGGLVHFKDCKNLTLLSLQNTKVTVAGIDELKKALPKAKIEWDDGVIDPKPFPPPAVAPFNSTKAKEHQEAWAKQLGVDVEFTNKVGMKLRLIPPGEFLMGSPKDEIDALKDSKEKTVSAFAKAFDSEGPQHLVRITKPFAIGMHEVTVGQFRKFIAATKYKTKYEKTGEGAGYVNDNLVDGAKFYWDNVGYKQAEDAPVWNVTWEDAEEFCRWLSEQDGRTYQLPTEAQWEYACRAGTQTRTYWGNVKHSNYAWGPRKIDGGPKPVGQLLPNAFGLYDMCGNVWEWCADWHDFHYYQVSPTADPSGPTFDKSTQFRVYRGGAVQSLPVGLSSTYRSAFSKNLVGFRVALVGDLKAKSATAKVDRKVADWVLSRAGSVSLADGKEQEIKQAKSLSAD